MSRVKRGKREERERRNGKQGRRLKMATVILEDLKN